jgi:putative cell wall-binding protein
MKSIHKILLILLVTVGIASAFTACKKDESGTPTISYVRITRPTSSDSLLVAAGQGQLIAIVGDNLQDLV